MIERQKIFFFVALAAVGALAERRRALHLLVRAQTPRISKVLARPEGCGRGGRACAERAGDAENAKGGENAESVVVAGDAESAGDTEEVKGAEDAEHAKGAEG